MSVTLRLAAFAISLVAIFGIGYGIGAATDTSPTPATPTHGEHAP